MIQERALARVRQVIDEAVPEPAPVASSIESRAECLEQLLAAFRDVADRDESDRAVERLSLVQAWIQQTTPPYPQENAGQGSLRLIHFWVPDVNSPEFAAEAHRQSLLAAQSPHAEEDQDFVDAISEWNER